MADVGQNGTHQRISPWGLQSAGRWLRKDETAERLAPEPAARRSGGAGGAGAELFLEIAGDVVVPLAWQPPCEQPHREARRIGGRMAGAHFGSSCPSRPSAMDRNAW